MEDEDLFYDMDELDIDDLDMIGDLYPWNSDQKKEFHSVLKKHGWGGDALDPVNLTTDMTRLVNSPFSKSRALGTDLVNTARKLYMERK